MDDVGNQHLRDGDQGDGGREEGGSQVGFGRVPRMGGVCRGHRWAGSRSSGCFLGLRQHIAQILALGLRLPAHLESPLSHPPGPGADGTASSWTPEDK